MLIFIANYIVLGTKSQLTSNMLNNNIVHIHMKFAQRPLANSIVAVRQDKSVMMLALNVFCTFVCVSLDQRTCDPVFFNKGIMFFGHAHLTNKSKKHIHTTSVQTRKPLTHSSFMTATSMMTHSPVVQTSYL